MAKLTLTKHFSVILPILGRSHASQLMAPLDFSKEYSVPQCIKIYLCAKDSQSPKLPLASDSVVHYPFP